MGNAILHRRRLVFFVLAAVLALAVVVVLPKTSSAEPPIRYDESQVYEGFCDFPVLWESTGHFKVRALPGGDFLLTGRGVSTLTNVEEPDNQLIDRGGGAGRITPLTDEGLEGDVLVVARGHNFLFDPGEGIFLIIGRTTFTVAGGPFVGGDITILETHGRVINVCDRLA